MRAIRAVAVASVLALLGLLVWDLVHQHGPGVAAKVDKGKAVPAPELDLPRPQLECLFEGQDDARVLRVVVRLDAERARDSGDGRSVGALRVSS